MISSPRLNSTRSAIRNDFNSYRDATPEKDKASLAAKINYEPSNRSEPHPKDNNAYDDERYFSSKGNKVQIKRKLNDEDFLKRDHDRGYARGHER